jgi:conjugal transfer mating pair stabilization protein TraN
MLFRCGKKYSIFSASMIAFAGICVGGEMDQTRREAESFARKNSSTALESAKKISLDGFERGESFDPDATKNQILNGNFPKNESVDFVLSEEMRKNSAQAFLDSDEYLFTRAEEILGGSETISQVEVDQGSLKKCFQSGEPYVVSYERILKNESYWTEELTEEIRVCRSHEETEKHYWKSDAKKAKKRMEDKFSRDPLIKSYHVEISGGGISSDYKVTGTYRHIDNCDRCKKQKIKVVVIKPSEKIDNEYWEYSDPKGEEILQSPDGRLIRVDCLETKEGKCIREKLSFLESYPERNDCAFLKSQKCTLVSSKCLHNTERGCALWEKTFRCFNGFAPKGVDRGDVYGTDLEMEYPDPNGSFAEVSAKLSIFAEMKSDIERSGGNAQGVRLFGGKNFKCSKNVMDNLLYDCCSSLKGLTTEVGLSQCNADEIALAEMRSKGLCHYVGKKSEKTLGIKTSDSHVFCCFNSKLSRVLQEQGRKQLGIDWGSAEDSKCSGFSHSQIEKLDFNKLDLTEMYEDVMDKVPGDIEGRLKKFEARLEDVQGKMEERVR